MFVDDIALERPDVTDVLHAVTAVGSRDKTKAAEFIEKHLPKGATAQQAGLAPMPVACGSYQEVFEHPVSCQLGCDAKPVAPRCFGAALDGVADR